MILGHQKQWQYLKKLAELDKLPHALLFCGQEKLGKKTLALEFIKWLFGEDIEKKPHPDFIFIEPTKREIQISQTRELIWKLSLKPSVAHFKAAVINEAHCLNQEAQSSLLKILEEPKGNAILILITEYPEALLPTILSRVQKIKFQPVKKIEIENYLKEQGVKENERMEILEISEGKPGRAMDLIREPAKLKERGEKIKELVKILNSDLILRFQYAKTISEDAEISKEALDIWLSYFRKIFLKKCLTPDIKQADKLKNIIKLCQKTNFLISTTNVNLRLALEILMLEL